MCVGAIDGTNIPIKAPSQNHTDYVNRKPYHSIIMPAWVDSRYLFRDIVVGWPGSVHDARVLSNSEMYKLGNDGALFPDIKETILGQDIHPCILGNPAYPMLPWLLEPFPENQNTPRSIEVSITASVVPEWPLKTHSDVGKVVFLDFQSALTWRLRVLFI